MQPTHPGMLRTEQYGPGIALVDAVYLPDKVKAAIRADIAAGEDPTIAVIRRFVERTNGPAYRMPALGAEIPIPIFPERGSGLLLDVGCGWGRWSIAAARAGFQVVGIDPMMGLVRAADGLTANRQRFVCTDARRLPFADDSFDHAFSHSVLQHFSDADCIAALNEIGRVLKPGGTATVQLAHRIGLRSLWAQALRRFREPVSFDVRYRSRRWMSEACTAAIGPTTVAIDCFLGLGLQWSERAAMRPAARAAVTLSEALKRAMPVIAFADSLYLQSTKPATPKQKRA